MYDQQHDCAEQLVTHPFGLEGFSQEQKESIKDDLIALGYLPSQDESLTNQEIHRHPVTLVNDSGSVSEREANLKYSDGQWTMELLPDANKTLADEEVDHYLEHKFILESKINKLRAQMEAMIKQQQGHLNALNDKYAQRYENTMRERHAATGQKTFHHAYGTCRIRTIKQSYKIVDENAAIDWLMRHHNGCGVTRVLQKDEYKRLVDHHAKHNSGELLPGIDIEPERLSFSAPTASKISVEEE